MGQVHILVEWGLYCYSNSFNFMRSYTTLRPLIYLLSSDLEWIKEHIQGVTKRVTKQLPLLLSGQMGVGAGGWNFIEPETLY